MDASLLAEMDQTLYGFLRLRIPSGTSPILPDLKGCALIRELHVYGKLKKVVLYSRPVLLLLFVATIPAVHCARVVFFFVCLVVCSSCWPVASEGLGEGRRYSSR